MTRVGIPSRTLRSWPYSSDTSCNLFSFERFIPAVIKETKDMEENEFGKTLENLRKPSAMLPEHQRRLRLTYVNAKKKKSAWWGILLLLFAVAFIFVNSVSGLRYGRFGPFFRAIGSPSLFGIPLIYLLVIGGLLAALILNLLSIIHFSVEHNPSEIGLTVVVKKKYFKILVVLAIVALVGLMMIAVRLLIPGIG
jgi:hypothetical protein